MASEETLQGRMSALCGKYPGRKLQIDALVDALGTKTMEPPPTIFIHGVPATGKTTVTRDVLTALGLPCAYVDCVGCYRPKVLYEGVLNQLAGHTPSQANGYSNHQRCDNISDFVLSVRALAKARHKATSIVLILDQAERLRDTHNTELAAFLRLAELVGHPICVILIAQVGWSRFYSGTGLRDPLIVPFTHYSREEMLVIIASDCPTDCDANFFRDYVDFMSKVFIQATRDLNELRYMARLLFPVYRDPVVKGSASPHDTLRLIRHINPYLRSVLNELYLREVSATEWLQLLKTQDVGTEESGGTGDMDTAATRRQMRVERLVNDLKKRSEIELPRYSKYLLCAAYLASHNPSTSDRRFFLKADTRKSSKPKKTTQKKGKPLLRGPRLFPLERLMAIFYTIVEDNIKDTSLINVQLSTLVSLGYLTQASAEDSLDNLRYRCNAPLETVEGVARTIGFDLPMYIFEEH